jgi:cytochrome P450
LPRRVAKLEEGVREVVRGLIASWKDRGEVDLARELAWPMPYDVFFHLVGLPGKRDESREQLERWTDDLHGRVPGTPHLTPEAKGAVEAQRGSWVSQAGDRSSAPGLR